MSVSIGEHGQQIARYYEQYLGRTPVASEIADWVNHTNTQAALGNTGANLESIRYGIANHQEAKDYAARPIVAKPAPVTPVVETKKPEPPKSDPRLDELTRQWSDFQASQANLMSVYNNALAQNSAASSRNDELMSKVGELEEKLQATTEENNAAQEQLGTYRDREIGSQLARLRGGFTGGGSGYSSTGGGGDITSGGPAYQASRSSGSAGATVDASDSVISEGATVQPMTKGSAPQQGAMAGRISAVNRARQRLASGGATGYYKSRFAR